MKCPVCGAEQPVGMAYCDQCGSPLSDDTMPTSAGTTAPSVPVAAETPVAPPIAVSAPPLSMAKPSQSDTSAAPVNTPLAPTPTDQQVPTPSAAPAATPPAETPPMETKTLIFKFPNNGQFISTTDVTNIGRSDAAQDWHPELDVIPYGGGVPEMGVSRHHARLLRQNGKFLLMDVGSTNGTYVNGTALEYNKSMELKDGDTVAFGAFSTQVVLP